MSNISSMLPPVPLLTQNFPIPENMMCHGVCNKPLCRCINILEMDLNSVVELVMIDSKILSDYLFQYDISTGVFSPKTYFGFCTTGANVDR